MTDQAAPRVAEYLNTGISKPRAVIPEDEWHRDTPAGSYNLNFVFPVKVLETELVRLEPLIPSLHAEELFDKLSQPEAASLYTYRRVMPPALLSDLLEHIDENRRDPSNLIYVIIDEARPANDQLVGYTGYSGASATDLKVNYGTIMLLPTAQSDSWRTYVQTHATALLLQYALDQSPHGLDLRMVTWVAYEHNTASVGCAQRLGFKEIGIMRSHWLVNKTDAIAPQGTISGKHMFQITMEDWEAGTAKHIQRLVASSAAQSKLSVPTPMMQDLKYQNSVQPVPPRDIADCHPMLESKEYDLNFCLPVKTMEDDLVRLEPFIVSTLDQRGTKDLNQAIAPQPSVHGQAVHAALSHPQNARILDYFSSFKPGLTLLELLRTAEQVRSNVGNLWMVVMDKTGSDGKNRLAGLVEFMDASPTHNRWLEFGPILIWPQFQRTHVHTHTVGLMLQRCLDGGPNALGLRCVRWSCHHLNAQSAAAAERLGFTKDGTVRHHHAVPSDRKGEAVSGSDIGTRHEIWYSITREDWDSKVAARIAGLMRRGATSTPSMA